MNLSFYAKTNTHTLRHILDLNDTKTIPRKTTSSDTTVFKPVQGKTSLPTISTLKIMHVSFPLLLYTCRI